MLKLRTMSLIYVMVLASIGCLGFGGPPVASSASWGEAIVRASPFPDLIVEVDVMNPVEPSSFALNALMSTLRNVTEKRSITLAPFETLPGDGEISAQGRIWTVSQLRALAAEHLDSASPGEYGRGQTAVLHIMYLDGSSDEYEEAVGLQIGGTAFLFRSRSILPPVQVPDATPGPSPGDLFERAVLIHEVGHVMGLVNNGIPMQRNHADPSDPHHSSNPKSVMNAAVDAFKAQVGTVMPAEAPPYEFDADDLADIMAFRVAGRSR